MIDAGAAFDLMLSDVVMPDIDGPQAARLVTERRPGMKVLFMSGYSEDQSLDPGCEYLPKPFRREVLIGKVRQVLDRKTPAAAATQ